jgi:hypothetical protein
MRFSARTPRLPAGATAADCARTISPRERRDRRAFPLLSSLLLPALCIATIVCGGCAERNAAKARVKTFPWAATAKTRPVMPQLENASYRDDGSSPDLVLDVEPPPSPLVLANATPARPRVPVAPAGNNNAAKFEPLSIVPQLTPEESQAAQQQTNSSLSIAERNMTAARGRSLNAAQSDLVSKVRSFVSEAREAAHNGDWTRASTAAKKAQVLSEELARSL